MKPLILSLALLFTFAGSACSQQDTNESHTEDVSLNKKIGEMLNIGFRGMTIADTNHIVRDITKYHLGGVTLFDYDVPLGKAERNIKSPEQLKTLINDLQSLSETPLIVAIDQEGGKVARLKPNRGFPASVSAQYLGQLNNLDSTRYYARQTAEMLSDLGINTNLAPVVDVNTNPDNPVIGGLERSFSSDPQEVTNHAKTYIKVLHEHDILTTLKHFPGHGSSEKDSHLGVVDVTDTWSANELIPYRELIDSGLVDLIMTAHIYNARWDSSYPATLSKPVITGMLRDSLSYDGVVISDDLMMGAIRKEYGLKTAIRQAINAGVDILSFANNSVYDPEIVPKANRLIKELLKEGEISEDQIDQSYNRIITVKEEL
ncbi:glycoside hydrolase family 3 [Aliifodinibius salicampi]|uniref:beta-N-acetylhexosaminidase n=1 Tax=Fodinibius salicampi TaxID=1920655 RepID=A0ABT3PZI9_9BACT|nr:glycoside hydrolase family 3 N-terminal domain-containing protein [Fodinibius salicampi]MCW9713259.1 glycoside hydrolase family 3 [Fodinibius salicampi]